ncbi:MAG: CoA-binding protein [Dehalococcoidia bacterium]
MSEHPLDPIFHPRAIALVGVPEKLDGRGADFFLALLDQGFHERKPIYVVHPRATEIRGIKAYPTLLDCPEPVDHVISLIPRHLVATLVDQCVEKRVRSLHFFTAGFSESGEEGMAAAERELAERARAGGVRVLGPNCMGLYVPDERISFSLGFPTDAGNVMMISQSGANAGGVVSGLAPRGLRFSKVVSFGNGSDIDAAELFEYASSDADTEVVLAYIEGVPDGRRFLEAVRRCARVKPTIILKGGFTAAGARAASSHTGSLAGSAAVFEAMCRQTGALRVDSLDEMFDMAVAVTTRMRAVRGRRAVLTGGGGGFSVLSADVIARADLEMPDLPIETQERLREWVPVAGNSVHNPIDAGFVGDRHGVADEVTAVAAEAPGYDFVIASRGDFRMSPPRPGDEPSDPQTRAERDERRRERALESARTLAAIQERTGRPVIAVRREYAPEPAGDFHVEAQRLGLAAFFSVPAAAHTVDTLLRWRERREDLPEIL